MLIRISQLRQRLDDWQLPLEEVAARALRVKRGDVRWARLARKSVDARDKGDVHLTLTLDVETARPVRLPKNAVEVRASGSAAANVPGGTPEEGFSGLNQWPEKPVCGNAAADAPGGTPAADVPGGTPAAA